ncbi:hypothetical protein Tco_0702189 [Tanacetum coccineum]|uniref:Uncharacterized protein n=1 Tax=Tanacetum coccineum TaxID=301880 RepID=A0ABQ4XX83_9ASTR
MTKLAFCDYHNMVAILEKTEHNTDFHQIVDFLQASRIMYALTECQTTHAIQSTPPEAQTTPQASLPHTTNIPSHTPTPRRMTKRAIRISQSKALSPVADEIAPPTRGDRYGEAFPTATSLDAGQDRENIPKTSAMPHELFPRVTSLGGDEGSLK